MDFRWNEWNLGHVPKHGVTPEEAQEVVEASRPPWPESREDDKFAVWGRTRAGRILQVIYVTDADGTIFVIHARPLNRREQKSYRRRAR